MELTATGEAAACRFACAKAYTALSDYAALCDGTVFENADFKTIEQSCSRMEPWRINGAPLTKLECGAPVDAPDGVNAHLGEIRAACGPLTPGGKVCPDNCREPFTVLDAYYRVCGVTPAPEHAAARKAGCAPLAPAQHAACACAAAAGNWSIQLPIPVPTRRVIMQVDLGEHHRGGAPRGRVDHPDGL